jgi:hypothetical protein
MSAITFTTRDRSVRVSGAERSRGAMLAGQITGRKLGLDTELGMNRARRILPRDFFEFATMRRMDDRRGTAVEHFASWAVVSGMVGGEGIVVTVDRRAWSIPMIRAYAGTQGVMETVLNTAIAFGADAEVLLARIHGSAEDGVLIAERDRGWLATLIGAGLVDGGPFGGQSRDRWTAVAAHLDDIDGAPGPALLTCSQGQDLAELGAQAAGIVDIEDEEQREVAWEAWTGLDPVQLWDRSIKEITAERADKPWLRLSPETFRTRNYADGFTAQDAVTAADDWWQRNVTSRIQSPADFGPSRHLIGRSQPAGHFGPAPLRW